MNSKIAIISVIGVLLVVGGGLGIYFGVTSGGNEDDFETTTTVMAETTTRMEDTTTLLTTTTLQTTTTEKYDDYIYPTTPSIESKSNYTWTDMDRYVWKQDDTYSWTALDDLTTHQVDEDTGAGFTYLVLNVTTQTWLSEEIVDCSVWWHYVSIIVPDSYLRDFDTDNPLSDSAALLIGSGRYTNDPPTYDYKQAKFVRKISLTTNSIGVLVRVVPMQPCVFSADPKQESRTEDDVIAWTWKMFLDDPESNPETLLRLPMTKSVVKSMDAVSEFMKLEFAANIGRFCVTGASKRGWTAWTVAAIDYKRVQCTMPQMMDDLNLVENLHNHIRTFGNWTIQFADYWELDLLGQVDSENFQKLANVVDPFSYRERYQHSLVYYLSMGNDEFFLLDDTHKFWKALSLPDYKNYIQIVPNCGHDVDCAEKKMLQGMIPLYYDFMSGGIKNLPKVDWFRWNGPDAGKVEFREISSSMPSSTIKSASVWQATSVENTRDFRRSAGNFTCWELRHNDQPYEGNCQEDIYQLDKVSFTQWAQI